MCHRSDKDPLVRVLTDKYRLNILRVPRAGINVGELLIEDSGNLRCMGSFARFFDPPLELPKSSSQELAPVSGAVSRAISAELAAKPLVAFLTALGLTGITALSAELNAARKLNVTFEVSGATLDSIDVVDLGNELGSRQLRRGNALYQPDRQFFVAHAVARATGLVLDFQGEGETGAKLAANVVEVAKGSGKVAVKQTSAAQINVIGSTPLVFGLAVLRLIEGSNQHNQLKLDIPKKLHPVLRKANASDGTPKEIPSVLLNDSTDELLLDVSDPE
jgi:hypothetical protein